MDITRPDPEALFYSLVVFLNVYMLCVCEKRCGQVLKCYILY